MRLPDVFGLLLCKRMEVDLQARNVSLTGIFHALRFRQFPSPPQRFTVYSALYDGVGEGTIELVVTRLETEDDVYRYQKWLTLPGRGKIVNLEIKVTRCVFPAPGRYSLTLRFDERDLTRRHVDVGRTRGKS